MVLYAWGVIMEKEIKYENKAIADFHIPRWNELPNIALYIDQVICYLDNYLLNYTDAEKEGHILTKTMINNYVKNSIMSPTVNKKYNKEHIAKLFVISILKQIYSINDVAKLMEIGTKKVSMEKAYDSFCNELENAVSAVFAGKEYKNEKDITFEGYVLKNVVLSFVNKLYVEKAFLKKF